MRETTYNVRLKGDFSVKSGLNQPIRMFCSNKEANLAQIAVIADGYLQSGCATQLKRVIGQEWTLRSFTVICGGLNLEYCNSVSGEIQNFPLLSILKNSKTINGVETHDAYLQFFVPRMHTHKDLLKKLSVKECEYRRYDIHLHRHMEKYYYRIITIIKEYDNNANVARKFQFNNANMLHSDEFGLPDTMDVTEYIY